MITPRTCRPHIARYHTATTIKTYITMKKLFLTVFMALSATVPALSADNKPYDGSRIFWDLNSRATVFDRGVYARIIQLQDGRLMATCESGGIVIAFSSDMGRTWSQPVKIVTNRNNTPNCVPDLIQLHDGTIIVAYNPRPAEPYTTDRKFGIRCKRSTDNGATWSDEIFVNDAQHTFNDGCWEPSMLELPSGEVQLYYADEGPYTSSDEQQISMRRSLDGGLTWGSVNRISFRAGYRDGMPVPVLLKDGRTIVVAIEDNGWPGYGDFFPTTVRCDIDKNWKRFCVGGDSENRDKTLDLDYCQLIKGGAPYIRVMPSGETIISWQSIYNHGGTHTMYTAVGNSDARGFKAVSTPFVTSATDRVMWNSLAVIGDGAVVAVGSVNGRIEMIKGYPSRLIEAPYAHPVTDGILTPDEGYLRPDASQIMLGTQTGVRSTVDMAYDDRFLYVSAMVDDATNTTYGSNMDGVRVFIDAADNVSDTPQKGMFSFVLQRDNTCKTRRAENGRWTQVDGVTVEMKTVSTDGRYVMEAAIPWTALEMTAPPTGRRMGIDIEVVDCREGSSVIETLPDAQRGKSTTYMEFRLKDKDDTSGITTETVGNSDVKVNVSGNTLIVDSNTVVNALDVYSPDGRIIARVPGGSNRLSTQVATPGLAIVKMTLDGGTVVNRKIIVGQ